MTHMHKYDVENMYYTHNKSNMYTAVTLIQCPETVVESSMATNGISNHHFLVTLKPTHTHTHRHAHTHTHTHAHTHTHTKVYFC